MTTLAVLRPLVAADLRDAGMVTFTSAVIDELKAWLATQE